MQILNQALHCTQTMSFFNRLFQKTAVAGILAIFVLSAGIAHAQNDISKQIDFLIKTHKLADAKIGIEIATVNSPGIVYQKNPNLPLVPASNNKIITTAAALDMLGKDYCHITTLFGKGKIDAATKTFNGDIYVKGNGDPNISGRLYANNPVKVFEDWAVALKSKGVTAINGNLVLDDTAFDYEFTNPSWQGEIMTEWYTAPVSALSLNDNCIDINISPGAKTGSPVRISTSPATNYVTIKNNCTTSTDKTAKFGIARNTNGNEITLTGQYYVKNGIATKFCTIYDPSMYFGCVLWETLTKNGISINGKLLRGKANFKKTDPGVTSFAELRAPLTATLAITNKKSQNFYAEQLLKTLGHELKGLGSFNNGIVIVNIFLKKVGMAENTVAVKDGSGLSKQNLQTADSITRVLWYMYHSPNAKEFIASLAQSGEDNTGLEKRLADKPGRIYAKTGRINGSCCLSGYALGKSGEVYIFSILVNQFKGTETNVKDFHDAVCRLLTER